MWSLLNTVAAVAVIAGAVAFASLNKHVALILALGGAVTANFLGWVMAPDLWQHVLTPWVVSAIGVLIAIAGWAAVRAYDSVFVAPGESVDDTSTGRVKTVSARS